MEIFESPYLANLVFVVSMVSMIFFVGRLSDKKQSAANELRPLVPSEEEMRSARKLQQRLIFLMVVLTIAGFTLGGYTKGIEAQPMKTLYWLALMLIAICPGVILFLQDEKTVRALSRNRHLWLEFLLILIGGITEILFFVNKELDHNIPLLSCRGMTTFLLFVGLWLFLFFRLGRKIQD